MTQPEVFAADLARVNAQFEAAGALVTYSDGFVGIDESKVSAALLGTYSRLVQFGYANGLV